MNENTLRIALAQMDVKAGQPTQNFETMADFVEKARSAGADIAVFPRKCLGGSFIGNRSNDSEFLSYLASFNEKLAGLSSDITIVYGNVVSEPGFPERAFLASDGVVECDLADGFALDRVGIQARIGVSLGNASAVAQDCGVQLVLDARPFILHGGPSVAEEFAAGVAETGASPLLVHVNCVGMQGTDKAVLSFDGDSAVYGPDGSRIASCREDFEEDLLVVSVHLEDKQVECVASSNVPRYDDEDEKVLDGIVSALRRFDEQVFPFHPKWVIGLSGGLDSSVTAALMCLAFGGPERIVGYNLATRYNSDATKMNAYELAQALGISLVNGSIEEIVAATGTVMGLYGYPEERLGGLVQENIQARLRGHMLSTFAAVEGGVIMNNGNKIEAALGYATLYGDAVGAIAPIGDVTKVRLFNISRIINRRLGVEAVPMNLVPEETEDGYNWETMPSAELKDAQRDPMKWFYHDWLVERLLDEEGFGIEDLMEGYLNDRLQSSDVAKWVHFYGLDDPQAFIEDIEWVLKQMAGSAFKRVQMPPTIMVVRNAYGYENRENQVRFERTARYEDLKRRILSMG